MIIVENAAHQSRMGSWTQGRNTEEVSMSKHMQQQSGAGIGRWLRIGFLSFTVLGPAISTVLERQRAFIRLRRPQAREDQTVVVVPEQEVKPSLGESLLELPYAQVLLRRGEGLANELRERGNKLSQTVVEHGGKVSHDLIDRSSDLTRDLIGRGGQASQEMLKQSEKAVQELRRQSEKAARVMRKQSEKAARRLTKQSKKASKELTRRGEKITQGLVKRGQEFTHDLTQRNGRAWTIVGFAVGLLSASAVAYILISKRTRHEQGEEAEQHILLAPNGYQNLGSGTSSRVAERNGTLTEKSAAPVQQERVERSIPADAELVGVVSTRHYYPVETPLADLQEQARERGELVDIIYFSSEEEAKAQGFSAASGDTKNIEG
jgi:polyhydroxyalkanoate synthesis regulator phasin